MRQLLGLFSIEDRLVLQPSRRSPIYGAGWFGDLAGEVVTGTL